MGASLLALFLNLKINLGFNTIVIAHVMFCISFVVVTVKARIASLDPRLEQAAMDLYADEVQTFRRVTLPAGGAGHPGRRPCWRSRCRSTTSSSPTSTRATVNTFPKFVYVSSLRGIPAQANVIASAMFFLALIAVVFGQFVGRPPESAVAVPRAGAAGRGSASAALVDVRHVPFWLDGPAPDPAPALAGRTVADLAVVGAGYTGSVDRAAGQVA